MSSKIWIFQHNLPLKSANQPLNTRPQFDQWCWSWFESNNWMMTVQWRSFALVQLELMWYGQGLEKLPLVSSPAPVSGWDLDVVTCKVWCEGLTLGRVRTWAKARVRMSHRVEQAAGQTRELCNCSSLYPGSSLHPTNLHSQSRIFCNIVIVHILMPTEVGLEIKSWSASAKMLTWEIFPTTFDRRTRGVWSYLYPDPDCAGSLS